VNIAVRQIPPEQLGASPMLLRDIMFLLITLSAAPLSQCKGDARPAGDFFALGPLDFDQHVVKRRRAAHIGQCLAGEHIGIGSIRRELAPPDR
jgi:hypothetical protein